MKKLLLSLLLITLTASGFAQWSANPRVNTPVAGGVNAQHANKSIADGLGGVIVLISDTDYSNPSQPVSKSYLQKLSSTGTKLWGAAGIAFTNSTNNVSGETMVSDGSGGVVLIWTEETIPNDYNSARIFSQHIDVNGNRLWGQNGLVINATNSEYGISDNILRDASGNYVFAYTNYVENKMYAQKLNTNGQLQWGAGTHINEGVSDEAEGGLIYADGAGYIILWGEDYEDPLIDEDTELAKWQRINADGTKNGSNLLLYNFMSSPGLRQEISNVVPNGNGGFYVTLVEYTSTTAKLYLQQISSNGTKLFNPSSWGIEIDASIGSLNGSYVNYGVAMQSDGANGVVVGWTDERSGNKGLYAQRFNSAGVKLWASADIVIAPTLVSSDFYDGHIQTDVNGNFVFAFTKEAGSTYRHVYVQKVSETGVLLYQPAGVLVAGSNTDYKYSEMIALADKVVFIWSETRNNSNSDIFAQSVFNNGSLTGTFAVLNARNSKGFNTIQEAIDDNATIADDEIQITAGTYTENVKITKSLKLNGSNAGVAPWNWTNSASVIKPPVTDFTTSGALMTISANNVKIDGISFDGTNELLSDASPRNINGKAVRSNVAITTGTDATYNTPQVVNNKIENFSARGVSLFSNLTNATLSILNNEIDNIVAINTTSTAGAAYGILSSDYAGGDISNNRITKASTGILTQYTKAAVNNSFNIQSNNVEAYKIGISITGVGSNTPTVNTLNNTVNLANYASWTADGLNKSGIGLTGMYFYGLGGDNNVVVTDNNVSNANWGISTSYIQKSTVNPNRFTISGGTLNNNYLGVDNYTATNNAYTARIVLSGVRITNSGLTGVRNYSTTGTFKSELILKDGVQIINVAPATTYLNAITIEGANAQLNELNNTKISGARTNFISIASSAMTALTVDGKDVTYDGTVNGQTFSNYKPSATFDLTLRGAVKARIYDGEDAGNTTAGIVTIPSTLPVSLIDFNASLKTNGALVTWSTASELNNKNFLVEKSTDGTTFQTLATIDGKGTTHEKSSYQFTDVNFFQSAYYRLTQVDLNGTKTVYDDLVRHVKSLADGDKVAVYPNPTVDKINIKLPVSVATTAVKLIDINGKALESKSASGGQVLTFAMQHLPKGLYLVQYTDEDQLQTQKVVKQ